MENKQFNDFENKIFFDAYNKVTKDKKLDTSVTSNTSNTSYASYAITDTKTNSLDISSTQQLSELPKIQPQDKSEFSTTSLDSEIIKKQKKQKIISKEKNYSILLLVLLIALLVIYSFGFYKLLINNKYKYLYDCEKYIITINLLLSYFQIFFILYILYRFKELILQKIKSDNMFRYGFIIISFVYIIYMLSIFRFTYILNNIENYKEEEYCFLTKYYIFMQCIPFIVFFYFLKNKNFTFNK